MHIIVRENEVPQYHEGEIWRIVEASDDDKYIEEYVGFNNKIFKRVKWVKNGIEVKSTDFKYNTRDYPMRTSDLSNYCSDTLGQPHTTLYIIGFSEYEDLGDKSQIEILKRKKATHSLKGCRTRAPSKKPVVKVNVRRMF